MSNKLFFATLLLLLLCNSHLIQGMSKSGTSQKALVKSASKVVRDLQHSFKYDDDLLFTDSDELSSSSEPLDLEDESEDLSPENSISPYVLRP